MVSSHFDVEDQRLSNQKCCNLNNDLYLYYNYLLDKLCQGYSDKTLKLNTPQRSSIKN